MQKKELPNLKKKTLRNDHKLSCSRNTYLAPILYIITNTVINKTGK